MLRVCGQLAICLLFVCASLVGTGSVRAEDDVEAAKAHYTKGTRYYEVGDYREALTEFKAAHLAKSDPAFLYNIAQCHRQLGDLEQAVVMYKRYLATFPKAPNREEVERRVADLETSLAEKRKEAGEKPVPATPPAAVPPEPAPIVPTPEVAAKIAEATPPAPPSTPAGSSLRYLRWVGAAVTLGLAGGAIGTGLSANSKYNHLRDTCGKSAAGCSSSEIDSVKSRALLTNVLWGAAGAAAIATGLCFYLTPSQASAQVAWSY